MSGSLLSELVPGGAVWGLATSLCIISIVLAGIALGMGRALGSRKLWAWGAEELGQAVLNAALLGGLAAITLVLSGAVGEMAPAGAARITCAFSPAEGHAAMALSICTLEQASNQTQNLTRLLAAQSHQMGLLGGLEMDVNVVRAAPYAALSWPAKSYADWAYALSGWQALLETQKQFLMMVARQGFAFFLPAGLLLRLFFPTRKLGGAVMAGAVALFLAYPLAYGLLVWGGPLEASYRAAFLALEANGNALATLPALDWNQPGAIAAMMQATDGQQLAANAAGVFSPMGAYLGVMSLYLVAYPLVALGAALAAGVGLAGVLGSEMRLDLMEMV